MKKEILNKLTRCFMVLSLLFITMSDIVAQNKTITISISDIEYENPTIESLKKSLKNTPKVTSVKSSYADNIAQLNILYAGSSDELWGKIPATTKKNLKLNSLSEDKISLNYLSSSTSIATTKTNINNNKSNKDADCKSCNYFPICNYDYTRTFQGKEYKGIDYDGNIVYFRYENGNLITKTERFDEWGVSMGFLTEIKIKCNAEKGAKWVLNIDGGLLGTSQKEYEILDKGISLTINGEKYSDVLKISEKIKGLVPDKNGLTETVAATTINYYAKGIGLVKNESEDIFSNFFKSLMNEDKKSQNETQKESKDILKEQQPQYKENLAKLTASYNDEKGKLKGIIDKSILGTWKFYKSYTPQVGKPYELTAFYTFFDNGNFEYYVPNFFSVTDQSKNTFTGEWRIDGNEILLLKKAIDSYIIERKSIKKKNDSVTGRPKLIIQHYKTEEREYEFVEKKGN